MSPQRPLQFGFSGGWRGRRARVLLRRGLKEGPAALSMLAANWFMLAVAGLACVGIAVVVIPREEEALLRKFGVEYQVYRQRTGRLAPRLFR